MSKTISFFLVDDDPDDTSLFQEVVAGLDIQVQLQTAVDGHQALEKLKNGNTFPDVIFLDLNMPRMDGKECLIELKQDPQLRHIPVVMYTTSSQSKDIEETMMNGAVCFITKPTNIRELKLILNTIASNLPHNLLKGLQLLSNNINIFIIW